MTAFWAAAAAEAGLRRWAEVGDGDVEEFGDGRGDEVVVVALGQAGDDDGAGEGVAGDGIGGVGFEPEGEASAVGGVVGFAEAVRGFERGVVARELAADGVGAAVEAVDGVALAANPVGLRGLGAGRGAGEEELAVALDLDGSSDVAGEQRGVQERAELPCGGGIEGGEAEQGFLPGEEGEVGDGVGCGRHEATSLRRAMVAARRCGERAQGRCCENSRNAEDVRCTVCDRDRFRNDQ